MTNELMLSPKDHKKSINLYIDWLFKDKRKYVILKSYYNSITDTTKLFVALPVREREFVSDTQAIFTSNDLINTDFPFNIKDLLNHKTIYSGNMFEFWNFPKYLSYFKLNKSVPNPNQSKYSTLVKYVLFKDYTTTRQKQEENFSLVKTFTKPYDSIQSIYRLLQTKYITVIDIEFKGKKL